MKQALHGDDPGAAAFEKTAILVVDDRPEKILVFRSVLEDLGQEVVTVSSGQDALKQVLERDFAVILLDVNMPGMDGFETAALIRKRRRSSLTPIIFMTAYADEMHAAQAYSLGAVDFILTPFAPDVLRAKVRVFVHLHQMQQSLMRQADQRIALAREQAARSAAEDAVRRAAFLAEGGRLLTSSLDAETLARDLTQFSVPYLGGLCMLALLDEQGRPVRTELAWADPDSTSGRRALCCRRVIDPALQRAIEVALASGRREVLEGPLTDGVQLAFERLDDGCEERVALAFAPKVIEVLPLVARGRTLGTLAIALAPPRNRFTAAEISLAEEVAGRAAIALDNATLYRQVRDNDRRKDEFLAMLAHELRGPLAPIRHAVEVLKIGSPDSQRLPWARDVIDRQSRQMVRLVDDLLDVSRITRGKVQLKMEDVDLGAVLAAAIEASRPLVDEKRHELVVKGSERLLRVKGDFARIAQVVSNLLNNAAKYTPSGGRVEVSVGSEGAQAVIRVADNGLGIPAHMLEGIFELFTQLDTSLDRAQGGLGIGLTLVRRLVEAQGGTVSAESAGANRGSEFTVRLPLSQAAAIPEDAPRAAAGGASRRILIVEDHPDSAQTLATLVALDGHEVRIAPDGLAALGTVAQFKPEVVLVDIGLPGMDGFEVARRLRSTQATRASLIIAVTGYGQERDREEALAAGFDHHLVKPVNVKALGEVIRAGVKKREAV